MPSFSTVSGAGGMVEPALTVDACDLKLSSWNACSVPKPPSASASAWFGVAASASALASAGVAASAGSSLSSAPISAPISIWMREMARRCARPWPRGSAQSEHRVPG